MLFPSLAKVAAAMLQALTDRFRGAVRGFRNPHDPDAGIVANFNVDHAQMQDTVEDTLADAFRQFAAPDGTQEATGFIDHDLSRSIGDDMVEDLPNVPDDARVARFVLDAPNKVRVYYHVPRDDVGESEWGMTPSEFYEAINEVFERQGSGTDVPPTRNNPDRDGVTYDAADGGGE